MKSAFLLSVAVLLCGWRSCHCQSTEGLTSAATGQFNALNRQLSVVQSVLSELSRSLGEVVNTGTRTVNSNTEALSASFTPIINQLSTLQQALNNVATQAQKIIESSSRVITGQPLASAETLDNSATAVPSATPQSEASTAAPATTAKIDTTSNKGTPSETAISQVATTGPALMLVRTVDATSKQLGQVTAVVDALSRQMTNILTTGARTLAVNRLNPADSVLDVMEEYVKQIADIHKSLKNVNDQFNRLIETGTFGGGSGTGLRRQKRADTLVVAGLEKAARELTREIGQIGGTLARVAGGISGVRIPGTDSDNRGAQDGSASAFQGLNPVGVISRGFGNLASSLTRVLPSTGRK